MIPNYYTWKLNTSTIPLSKGTLLYLKEIESAASVAIDQGSYKSKCSPSHYSSDSLSLKCILFLPLEKKKKKNCVLMLCKTLFALFLETFQIKLL